MMSSSDILPMHPGYALGGIISESDLLLPLYEKKRDRLEEEVEKLVEEKNNEMDSEKHKSLDGEAKQQIVSNYAAKIIRAKRQLGEVCLIINKLIEEDANFNIVSEALPLDENNVKLRNENRSFKAERMDHLVFTSKDHVLSRIQSFVNQLFLHDAPSTILPSGALAAMAKNIEHMLSTTNTSVALIGSFIWLERVKIIEPLIIRPNTRLSTDLISKSDKHYVLCEAVLGGVFLGLGKEITVSGQLPPDGVDKKWITSLATISFVSQGAIPKLNHKVEEVNLWNVYNNWKEALISDPNSGYPIGFKIRCLQDVLIENQIPVNIKV